MLVNLDKVSLIMPNKDEGYVDIILDDDVHIFAKPVFINDRGRRCQRSLFIPHKKRHQILLNLPIDFFIHLCYNIYVI